MRSMRLCMVLLGILLASVVTHAQIREIVRIEQIPEGDRASVLGVESITGNIRGVEYQDGALVHPKGAILPSVVYQGKKIVVTTDGFELKGKNIDFTFEGTEIQGKSVTVEKTKEGHRIKSADSKLTIKQTLTSGQEITAEVAVFETTGSKYLIENGRFTLQDKGVLYRQDSFSKSTIELDEKGSIVRVSMNDGGTYYEQQNGKRIRGVEVDSGSASIVWNDMVQVIGTKIAIQSDGVTIGALSGGQSATVSVNGVELVAKNGVVKQKIAGAELEWTKTSSAQQVKYGSLVADVDFEGRVSMGKELVYSTSDDALEAVRGIMRDDPPIEDTPGYEDNGYKRLPLATNPYKIPSTYDLRLYPENQKVPGKRGRFTFSGTRTPADVRGAVLHTTASNAGIGSVYRTWGSGSRRASGHAVIPKEKELTGRNLPVPSASVGYLFETLPPTIVAWHAIGKNQHNYGIEFQDIYGGTNLQDSQINTGALLIAYLRQQGYPITHISRHRSSEYPLPALRMVEQKANLYSERGRISRTALHDGTVRLEFTPSK